MPTTIETDDDNPFSPDPPAPVTPDPQPEKPNPQPGKKDEPTQPETSHPQPEKPTPKPTDPSQPRPVTPTPAIPAPDPILGLATAVPVAQNLAGQLAAQAMPLPQITLQLKYVDQKELRDFSAEYTSSIATQRTYRPQGFFGLSAEVLANLPQGAFIEVDTDDEFWRMYDVTVHGPSKNDYETLGLRSAAVQLDYGSQDPRRRVTQTFEFMAQSDTGTPPVFTTPVQKGVYQCSSTLTYAFDGSWTGDPAPRTLPTQTTSLRDVYVVPQQDFRFVEVNASFTSAPDWTVMSQIQVDLECRCGANGRQESFSRQFVIHEGWVPSLVPSAGVAGALPWRIRFKDPDPAKPLSIGGKLGYVARDGKRREVPIVATNNPNLVFLPRP